MRLLLLNISKYLSGLNLIGKNRMTPQEFMAE